MNNFINNFFKKINKKILWIFFIILILITAVSIIHSFKLANNSLTGGGVDFQFSPTLLFLEGINPYQYFIDGNRDNKIFYAQWPSYSHLIHILIYPFTFFEWETARLLWYISNLILSLISIIIISNYLKLNLYETLIASLFFFCSSPFRNCISTGNQTFIILFIFLGLLIKHKDLRNSFVGISFIKYNFSPILAFYIYFKHGFRGLFFALITCTLGWLFFSYYLNENIFVTLFQPIKVALVAFYQESSRGDVFTILGIFKIFNNINNFDIYRILVVILLSSIVAKDISKLKNNFDALNLILLSSLFLFPHLMYDFIVLLPCFLYSLSKRDKIEGKISLIIVFYFWIGIRLKDYLLYFIFNKNIILSPISNVSDFQVIFNCIVLMTLYYFNKKLILNK